MRLRDWASDECEEFPALWDGLTCTLVVQRGELTLVCTSERKFLKFRGRCHFQKCLVPTLKLCGGPRLAEGRPLEWPVRPHFAHFRESLLRAR